MSIPDGISIGVVGDERDSDDVARSVVGKALEDEPFIVVLLIIVSTPTVAKRDNTSRG